MDYYIDTNIIIDFLNNEKEAKEKIKNLINDGELFINRLVIVETLRTIPSKNKKIFREFKKELDLFRQVDITPKIYNETILL